MDEQFLTADTVDSVHAGLPGQGLYQQVDFRIPCGPIFNFVSGKFVSRSLIKKSTSVFLLVPSSILCQVSLCLSSTLSTSRLPGKFVSLYQQVNLCISFGPIFNFVYKKGIYQVCFCAATFFFYPVGDIFLPVTPNMVALQNYFLKYPPNDVLSLSHTT